MNIGVFDWCILQMLGPVLHLINFSRRSNLRPWCYLRNRQAQPLQLDPQSRLPRCPLFQLLRPHRMVSKFLPTTLPPRTKVWRRATPFESRSSSPYPGSFYPVPSSLVITAESPILYLSADPPRQKYFKPIENFQHLIFQTRILYSCEHQSIMPVISLTYSQQSIKASQWIFFLQ